MTQIPTRLLENMKHATEILAGIAGEMELQGPEPTAQTAETFGYLYSALMTLNRALGINGQSRVDW